MRFLILIHNVLNHSVAGTSSAADHDVEGAVSAYRALAGELAQRGQLVAADRLTAPSAGRTVRTIDDQLVVTDGPVGESETHLAGFFLVDCDDLDQAVAIAKRMPGARHGMVEIRPVHTPG